MARYSGEEPQAYSDPRQREPEPENIMTLLDRLQDSMGGYSGALSPSQGSDDPEDFIRQQLAGDVVPLRPGMSNSDSRFLSGVNSAPIGGSSGQATIDRAGGTKSPYLDLLNILMFPQGGQIRR